jgi:hypothetical protein
MTLAPLWVSPRASAADPGCVGAGLQARVEADARRESAEISVLQKALATLPADESAISLSAADLNSIQEIEGIHGKEFDNLSEEARATVVDAFYRTKVKTVRGVLRAETIYRSTRIFVSHLDVDTLAGEANARLRQIDPGIRTPISGDPSDLAVLLFNATSSVLGKETPDFSAREIEDFLIFDALNTEIERVRGERRPDNGPEISERLKSLSAAAASVKKSFRLLANQIIAPSRNRTMWGCCNNSCRRCFKGVVNTLTRYQGVRLAFDPKKAKQHPELALYPVLDLVRPILPSIDSVAPEWEVGTLSPGAR